MSFTHHRTTRGPSTLGRLAGASLALAMGMTTAVHADILDLILDRATQASNRAASARDRAKEARDRAEEARDTAEEIRDRVEDGAIALTGTVRDLIDEKIGDMRDFVDEHTVAQQQFSSEQCETVRANLIAVLMELEYVGGIVEGTVTCEGATPIVDFGRLIALIDSVPCSVLLPVPELSPCLVQRLQYGSESLALFTSLQASAPMPVASEDGNPLAAFEAELDASAFWMDHYNALTIAQHEVDAMATALGVLAKVLKSLGETNFKTTLGIHGYAQVILDANTLKRLAALTDGVAGAVKHDAETLKQRLARAVDLGVQYEHLKNQDEIIRNQRILIQLLQGP